jgi:transposase-like protein
MASDLTGQMWTAVAGRRAGTPAGNPAESLRALLDAGVSKKEIAQTLGVTPRTVERWTTTTGGQRRDPAKSKAAERLTELGAKDPRVRERALSRYRKSRQRNRGGRVKINGRQGPAPAGKNYLRKRLIVHEIDGYAMDKVMQAWSAGDDDAAADAIREALEEQGYPDWAWDEGADVDFLAHSRD